MSTELWILPHHNKRCTLQFIHLKIIVHSVIHIVLFVIKNEEYLSSSSFNFDSTLLIHKNSTETVFSWRKCESYSQYIHPHLNHTVWKKWFKSTCKATETACWCCTWILMFRTVQIQTPLEIHSSLSHTMIWVKMRTHFSPKRCQF